MVLESILIVLCINLAGLFFCYTQQSDKATDLIYSISFFALTLTLWLSNHSSYAHNLLLIAVTLWSIRLGSYLFIRIHTMGKDDRFDKMRKNLFKISRFWFLQTGSILILSIPIIITFQKPSIEYHFIQILGFGIYLIGLIIESIADYQKFNFRKNTDNNNSFVNVGLWKHIQHPNYLGEILCWTGIFIIASSALIGWEWLALSSPVWITVLLIFISGIPFLRRSSIKKYGHLKEYHEYIEQTPYLFPGIF
ncbi:MAG: DUF1295 domain-containing protein [Saprospiraceae bacterium]|nr:DUF1295 domain-containing protein [Saprospiraceae bacterium]